jgi:hypothetical protein
MLISDMPPRDSGLPWRGGSGDGIVRAMMGASAAHTRVVRDDANRLLRCVASQPTQQHGLLETATDSSDGEPLQLCEARAWRKGKTESEVDGGAVNIEMKCNPPPCRLYALLCACTAASNSTSSSLTLGPCRHVHPKPVAVGDEDNTPMV